MTVLVVMWAVMPYEGLLCIAKAWTCVIVAVHFEDPKEMLKIPHKENQGKFV